MSVPKKIPLPPEIRQMFVEAGRRGGLASKERHGSELFREIGRIGGSRKKSEQRIAKETPEKE